MNQIFKVETTRQNVFKLRSSLSVLSASSAGIILFEFRGMVNDFIIDLGLWC